jgi:nucleoside-diphosphate-sugar epimerase
MTAANQRLFCFGLGYTGLTLARSLKADGWTVAGTCRDAKGRDALAEAGIEAFLFDGDGPMADAGTALEGATHLLNSVPPGEDGDPVLRHQQADIAAHAGWDWVGYLSTTGVYGDTGGAAVDETAPLNPTSERSRRRVRAEEGWRALANAHVFRLAGIYGPGRNALEQARSGTARRVLKSGHVFSRVHVDDIAAVLRASMVKPRPGAVYNVCDDVPTEPSQVTAHACELLGLDPPPAVAFKDAARDMSAMGLSFWGDHRRVDNSLIKDELGVALQYSDYRAGLSAILAGEKF